MEKTIGGKGIHGTLAVRGLGAGTGVPIRRLNLRQTAKHAYFNRFLIHQHSLPLTLFEQCCPCDQPGIGERYCSKVTLSTHFRASSSTLAEVTVQQSTGTPEVRNSCTRWRDKSPTS